MAGLYTVQSGAVALSASATKSLWLLNPADDRVRITEWSISFDASTAATAIRVDIYRTDTLGSPGGTTTTPRFYDPTDATAETTALTALTTEPTSVFIIESFYLTQNNGLVIKQYPLGRELTAAPSGARVGLRCVTPAGVTPNALSYVVFEE